MRKPKLLRMLSRMLPILVIILGFAVSWAFEVTKPRAEPLLVNQKPPLVRTKLVHPEDLRFSVQSYGNVMPKSEIDLKVKMDGEVIYLSPSFAAGGFFEKGEVLISLDARDYELDILSAKEEVAHAEQVLLQLEEDSKIKLRNWQSLYANQYKNNKTGNKKNKPTDLLLLKPKIKEAQAKLLAAQAQLKKANLRLDRTKIRAPFSGRVRQHAINLGEYVTAGQSTGKIYSIDSAEIRLPVSEAQLKYLELPELRQLSRNSTMPNVQVMIKSHTDDSTGESSWQWLGEIVRIEAGLDRKSRLQYLVARVDDPYQLKSKSNESILDMGKFVQAKIIGKEFKKIFVLPSQAIRRDNQVYIVNAENRLEFRKVQILRNEQNRVLIKSGLNSGERVVISHLDTAINGMRVKTPNQI